MKTREIIANSFKSKLFLVLMIGLSVVCGGYIISALASLGSGIGIIGLIVNALFAIAPTISVVCGWLVFAGKVNEGNIKGIKAYCSFEKVMTIIATVFIGIACGLIFALTILLIIIASEAEEIIYEVVEAAEEIEVDGVADLIEDFADLLTDGAIILAVVVAIVIGLIMFVMINLASTYGAIKKFFVRLADGYEEDKFNAGRKLPIKRLWIFGVLSALSAVPTMFISFSAAIPSLGTATFFIMCALWFKETNDAIAAADLKVEEVPAAEEAPVVEETTAE